MKIALFGGTFDPVHEAHLTVAREALEACQLDRVWFVPAANPPHKTGTHAPYQDRVRMLELACQGDSRFEVSRIEEGEERSYTIRTLERIQLSRPDDEIHFLIGADAFSEIETWYQWRDVVQAVRFIVVSRPGHQYGTPEGACVTRLETVALPVSSSEIRQRLASGEMPPEVPPLVGAYIRERGLYGTQPLR